VSNGMFAWSRTDACLPAEWQFLAARSGWRTD